MQLKRNNYTNNTKYILALLALSTTLGFSEAAELPAPASTGPSSAYTFPSEFSAFDVTTVTTNVSVHASAPEFAEWSRGNGPGDTMAITGSRFSSFTGDAEGRDTRFVYYANGQAEADGMIQRLDGMQAAVTLPDSLPSDEFYFLWAKNSFGYGTSAAINKSDAWWVGFDRVAGGETFSVYGRSLKLGNGKSYVYIEELNRWLTSSTANPYKADFVLPNDIANGSYTIWAHNGHGREFGWSSAKNLTVVNKVVWSGPTFNVKDYGAKGDGATDDMGAIVAAVSAANAVDFSTVYFPAGTYAFAGRLPFYNKNKIRYVGDGMDQTVITPHPNHASTGSYQSYVVYNCGDDSAFEDLTFAANQYGGNGVFYIRGQNRVKCERVRFSQLNSPSTMTWLEVVDTHKTTYIHYKDCEFILTGSVFFGSSKQQLVDGCDFYGLNDNNSIMEAWGGEQIAVINSTGQCYDNSNPLDGYGWCKGRFFHCLGSWGATDEIYFGENTTSEMSPRNADGVDQNSGEQFMSEGETLGWRGNPSAATSSTVVLPELPDNWAGNVLTVVEGKGMGQSRKLVSVANGLVTLDEAWTSIPDTSSIIVVGSYTRRIIIHGNYLEGTDQAVTRSDHTAVTGVEPYGGAVEWIVADNTMHKLRQGIHQFSIYNTRMVNAPEYVCPPHFFNEYKNNTLDGCREGIVIFVIQEIRADVPFISDKSYMGMLYRNNVMTNITKRAIQTVKTTPDGQYALTVFDKNSIHTKDVCVEDAEGQENYVWVGNSFMGSGSGAGMTIADNHVPSLRNNTWSGFSSAYGGTLPGAVLEVPQRVLELDSGALSQEVHVYNSGTEALNWTASASESWVNIIQSDNTIAGEQDVGAFTIEIDEATAPASETEAIITVSGDGQTKEMTVTYDAASVSPPPPPPPPTPVLTSIQISGPVAVNEGTSAQFSCTATYSDGSTASVNPTWTESSAFASINSSGLLAAGDVAADETVTLSASYDGETDDYSFTVSYIPPFLDHIEISGAASLLEGTSAQYTCVAHYSDGSTLAVNPSWSENSSAASISTSGLLTAGNVLADASATVTASFGGKSDTHAVTISYVPPTLTGLTIVGALSVDEESSAQYACVGGYSDGTTASVTPAWSENSSSASINSSGLLTTGNVGSDQSVLISASLGGINTTQAVTINYLAPTITGIEISGASTVDEESSDLYLCEAAYSDGARVSVTPVWSVSVGTATIDTSGNFTTGNVAADENATVAATFNGHTDSFDLTILYVAPAVTGISISGPVALEEGATAIYTCNATYSDGTTGVVTPIWSEPSPYVGINASGLLTAGDVPSDQGVTISAAHGGFSANHSLTVLYVAPPVVLTGLSISAPVVLNENSEVTLTCTASYSDGSTATVSPVWSTDNPVASIDSSGLLAVGNVEADASALITASFGGTLETHSIDIWVVGTQSIYPLTGFEGKTVKARLWDEIAGEWTELGEMVSPEELVIENVAPDQWYWVSVEEFNSGSGEWEIVHTSWISM
ncbi:MAG: glycosyl hydrolase family 28-related protein [Pontiella sp.]